jgi:hypothetical protein
VEVDGMLCQDDKLLRANGEAVVGLRFELKKEFQPPVSDAEYRNLKKLLQDARRKAVQHHVFWDIEEGETKAEVKKKLLYVAEKEQIPLNVQSLRKQNCLRLAFPADSQKRATKRLTADEARRQILEVLKKSTTPLSRREILNLTSVNPSSWNLRALELLGKGKIRKVGSGRSTRYVLDQRQLEIPAIEK